MLLYLSSSSYLLLGCLPTDPGAEPRPHTHTDTVWLLLRGLEAYMSLQSVLDLPQGLFLMEEIEAPWSDPWTTSFGEDEQQLYSELSLDDEAPQFISKAEPGHLTEETNFS